MKKNIRCFCFVFKKRSTKDNVLNIFILRYTASNLVLKIWYAKTPAPHFFKNMAGGSLTYSVDTLYRIYEEKEFINDTELNCALHDLAIYQIPLGLPSNEFRQRLTDSFFSHPFIKSFLENLELTGEIYFGSAKDWIHKNCTDVPTPRKWEITENIQILYSWLEKLGDGKIQIDRPNYSERLRIIK